HRSAFDRAPSHAPTAWETPFRLLPAWREISCRCTKGMSCENEARSLSAPETSKKPLTTLSETFATATIQKSPVLLTQPGPGRGRWVRDGRRATRTDNG